MIKELITSDTLNSVRLSKFGKFEGKTVFNGLAIKIVLKGKETYFVDGVKLEVGAGEFIIGNNRKVSDVIIQEVTHGLCLDLSNHLVSHIVDTQYRNEDFKEFITTDQLPIQKYKLNHSRIYDVINQYSEHHYVNDTQEILNEEFFCSVAEGLLLDQSNVFESLSKLNYKNREISTEVYRNLYRAKEYIDDQYLQSISLNDLSSMAHISKYAFIRMFKQSFGYSPYQYILHRRLQHAQDLLVAGLSISMIAHECGFSDIYAFSKAFKSKYNLSPSQYKFS